MCPYYITDLAQIYIVKRHFISFFLHFLEIIGGDNNNKNNKDNNFDDVEDNKKE